MKMFYVVLIFAGHLLSARADYQGVALTSFKQSINDSQNQLANWNPNQVNPCFWSSVICINEKVVSVILPSKGFTGTLSPKLAVLKSLATLDLRGNSITGPIPKEFGELSSLTNLDLENNRLTGNIPDSLGNLTKLQYLVLSQNYLTGNIPGSLSNLSSLSKLQLSSNHLTGRIPVRLFQISTYNFTDNDLNCGANLLHPCERQNYSADGSLFVTDRPHNLKSGVVIGIVVGIVGLLALTGILIFVFKCRHKGYRRDQFVDVSGEDDQRIAFGQLKRFSLRELQVATDNFNEKNVIGQGGFGKVYKGVLADSTKVAVKRLTNHHSPSGEAAFLREMEMISVAVHKNLLKLIGFCIIPSERLLVYPFMQHLSLAYCLREIKPGEQVLDWPKRKNIALGTARGLEYLHEHCNPKIIHRDVKAANVLLDEDFQAVVGDFGLAKLVDVRTTNVTTQVRGTMGHIAPEYLSTGKSSERTDVFGYGIMLLELVTGQRAIDFSRLEDEDDVLLLDHAKKLEREKNLDAFVDENLGKNYDPVELEMIVKVALLCTQPSPDYRPTMSEVVRMLEGEGLAERWALWQQVEMNQRREYERLRERLDWGEDSLHNQVAIELSGGR